MAVQYAQRLCNVYNVHFAVMFTYTHTLHTLLAYLWQ